jgi:hypothetical protein
VYIFKISFSLWQVPSAWLVLFDSIEESKREGHLSITMAEFEAASYAAGLPTSALLSLDTEMKMVLSFLGRLRLLMHHPAAPDLVILRPAEFLFPYFTRILYDFMINPAMLSEHAAACSRMPVDFKNLQGKGVVSSRLFPVLWEGRNHQAEV